jgi:hypothetical protein
MGKAPSQKPFVDSVKELIGDQKDRIKLNDLISGRLRGTIEDLSLGKFLTSAPVTPEQFQQRLKEYETVVSEMMSTVILLSRWGDAEQMLLLEKTFARLAEPDKGSGGTLLMVTIELVSCTAIVVCGRYFRDLGPQIRCS